MECFIDEVKALQLCFFFPRRGGQPFRSREINHQLTLKENDPMFTPKHFYTTRVRALASIALLAALAVAASAPFAPAACAAASPLPVMAMTPEQVEAAVDEYFNSVGAFDVQRYVNNFAPNGVLEDPVGTPPVQGTQNIAAFITSIIAPFSEIKHKIQDINVCGNEAAVNWKLHLKTTTGKKITIDGMGIFSFNQDGKLQSVREFWDLADFLAQLQG
jgi:steroid Delta-isomerase